MKESARTAGKYSTRTHKSVPVVMPVLNKMVGEGDREKLCPACKDELVLPRENCIKIYICALI